MGLVLWLLHVPVPACPLTHVHHCRSKLRPLLIEWDMRQGPRPSGKEPVFSLWWLSPTLRGTAPLVKPLIPGLRFILTSQSASSMHVWAAPPCDGLCCLWFIHAILYQRVCSCSTCFESIQEAHCNTIVQKLFLSVHVRLSMATLVHTTLVYTTSVHTTIVHPTRVRSSAQAWLLSLALRPICVSTINLPVLR